MNVRNPAILSSDPFFNVLSFFEPKELNNIAQVSKDTYATVSDYKRAIKFGDVALAELNQMHLSMTRHFAYNAVPVRVFSSIIGSCLSAMVQGALAIITFVAAFFIAIGITVLLLTFVPNPIVSFIAMPLSFLLGMGGAFCCYHIEHKIGNYSYNSFIERREKNAILRGKIHKTIRSIKKMERLREGSTTSAKKNFITILEKEYIERNMEPLRVSFKTLKKVRWKDHAIFRAFVNGLYSPYGDDLRGLRIPYV